MQKIKSLLINVDNQALEEKEILPNQSDIPELLKTKDIMRSQYSIGGVNYTLFYTKNRYKGIITVLDVNLNPLIMGSVVIVKSDPNGYLTGLCDRDVILIKSQLRYYEHSSSLNSVPFLVVS